jgi:hypothetical protein
VLTLVGGGTVALDDGRTTSDEAWRAGPAWPDRAILVAEREFLGNTQKMDCRLQGVPGRFSLVQFSPAHIGPDTAGARQQKEVTAVINTNVSNSQHTGFGMPVSGRVRVSSLRALPTTAVSPLSGQKCALMDLTQVIDGYRLVTGVAVATGAFPGTSAWSPPS